MVKIIILDDDDTPYKSRQTHAHCTLHKLLEIDWLTNSLIINPIEHIWNHLLTHIDDRPNGPATLAELQKALEKGFE